MSQNLPVKISCSFTIEVGTDGAPVVSFDSKGAKKADHTILPADVIAFSPPTTPLPGLSATFTGGITPYTAVVSGSMMQLACGRVYGGQPATQSGQNTWTLTFGGPTNPLISGPYLLTISTQSGAAQSYNISVANGYSYSC